MHIDGDRCVSWSRVFLYSALKSVRIKGAIGASVVDEVLCLNTNLSIAVAVGK